MSALHATNRGVPRATSLRALSQLPSAGGSWTFAGRTFRVTNLDKVLAPGRDGGAPVTKRQLLRYYALVAESMAPHLAGRPLNMHRFPNGIDRPSFWQKEAPHHAPSWMARWRRLDADPGETEVYLTVDEPAALPWLANFGALELHPWNSTTEEPDRPTSAYIDIDPGARTTWEDVLLLARLYRTALEHLQLRAYPKVTGSRGIQVWVPIERGPTFAETRRWVQRLSELVARPVPELVSWTWTVRDRGGLARLDYTQNAVNKTLVAPYSVRPRPGCPVSMPIRWRELEDRRLRPDRWTVHDAPRRLRAIGDLFAGALEPDGQVLPDLG